MKDNHTQKSKKNQSDEMIEYKMPEIKNRRDVYMDHAATTPVRIEVFEAMKHFFVEMYGNPSALHKRGREAKQALNEARKKIAEIFGCSSGEIIFVGSGTESDNLAIFGILRKYKDRGNRAITCSIEHHAVLNSLSKLKKEGFQVSEISVDREGKVDLKKLENLIDEKTTLVSIAYANNEIGTIQDIKKIASIIRKKKKQFGRAQVEPPFFHTDACQAAGYLDLDTRKLGVDLMTINGSKIYGPKGVGVLFVKKGIRLEPIIFGGGQENKLRAGTENVAGIVGVARALELANSEKESECLRLTELRDYMLAEILSRIPKTVLNGHKTDRLPNNVNVSILDIEGEAILLYLDEYGIAASTGSACDSQTLEPSHVIIGIGRPYEYAHGSIRFTLGRATTKQDIDYVLSVLEPVCKLLRKASPVDIDIKNN